MTLQRRLVLDAGALIDIETTPRGETFRSCVKAFDDGYRPYLQTVVLHQVWRDRARHETRRMCRARCTRHTHPLGRAQLKTLKVYGGPDHPHAAQNPPPFGIKPVAP